MKTLKIAALCTVFVVADLSATELVKGPILTSATTTSIVISWQTATKADGYIEVTPVDGGDVIVVNDSFNADWHDVTVDGLEAGKKYTYEVFAAPDDPLGGGSFRASVAPGQPFKFVVYGDNRSQHEKHKEVVASILGEEDIDFVVNTGDMVSNGEVEGDWATFFEIEQALLATHPIMPAVGNHEEDGGNVDLFLKYFKLPKNGKSTYYYQRIGNALFMTLDGHVEIDNLLICLFTVQLAEDCFNAAQIDWIKETLAMAKADPTITHVFTSTHIGPYSSKPGRTGSGQMRALLDDFLANKVKVVFSGHDHYFEHGLSANGLPYIVTGGGGAGLYETDPSQAIWIPHEVLTSESIHNYLVVEVSGDWVSVIAKDLNGKVITSFEIGQPPSCVDAADCEGEQKGICEGKWDCTDSFECQWLCNPEPLCGSPTDCTMPQPENSCDGEWTCPANTCVWDCAQVGECSTDADCAAKPALTDCPGGMWSCDAAACEWLCETPDEPADTGTGGTGGDTTADQPDPTGAGDDTTAETGTPTGGPNPVPVGPGQTEETPADDKDEKSGDRADSGCQTAPRSNGTPWALTLLLLVGLAAGRATSSAPSPCR